MGWSCAAKAGDVLRRWTEACVEQTGSQNVFEDRGRRYFFEVSRTEHGDGAITGSVHRETHRDGDRVFCQRAGTFRINGDGSVARAPGFLKRAAASRPARDFSAWLPGSGGLQ